MTEAGGVRVADTLSQLVKLSADREEKTASLWYSLVTGAPNHRNIPLSLLTFAINAALAAMVADVLFRNKHFNPSHELSFVRVGYVSPTEANFIIREPDQSKMPITLDILRKLCSALSKSPSAIDHTMKAAMALAFAGFLRCGEFTLAANTRFNPAVNLTRSSVRFIPDMDSADHLILTLPASKTDPFRKGVTIVIAAAPNTSTCR